MPPCLRRLCWQELCVIWAVLADEKTFVYGTTGYSEEMGDAGLNPHDNYSAGAACDMEWVRRFSNTMTIWKWNPGWQKAMNLQMTVP